MEQDFSPIPIPPHRRWQQLRVRVLPLLMFGAAMVGVLILWRETTSPASFVGQVEPVRSEVVTPVGGALVELSVTRFQLVKAGDPVAVVRPDDTRTALELMRTELELGQASLDPQKSARRDAFDYQRLRLAWLQQKVDLATARITLQYAGTDLERAQKLLETNSITSRTFDDRLRAKQASEAQVEERNRLVEELGRELDSLKAPARLNLPQQEDPIAKLLASQEEKLRSIEQNLGLMNLTAPIDGMVVAVLHRPGENLLPGTAVVQIQSPYAERIVGYLRQSSQIEPVAGTPVEVRTRSARRQSGRGEILHVGVGYVPISADLAAHIAQGSAMALSPEIGIPVEISCPPDLRVRPGELVDLVLR